MDNYSEPDNTRLDLDPSVLYERGGRNSSTLDKFGIPVFDKDILDTIKKYEQNEKIEIAYIRNNAFDNNLHNGDTELEYIKKQVFLSKQVKWEPLVVDDVKVGNKTGFLILLIIVVPLAIIGICRKKKVIRNAYIDNSDYK